MECQTQGRQGENDEKPGELGKERKDVSHFECFNSQKKGHYSSICQLNTMFSTEWERDQMDASRWNKQLLMKQQGMPILERWKELLYMMSYWTQDIQAPNIVRQSLVHTIHLIYTRERL